MSVPVRYSAAANYADYVDSGLTNTLQQEEQYHQQQLHTELYGHLYNNNQIPNSININFGGSSSYQLAEQQQQQQWSSMSSSSSSLSSSSPVKRLPTDMERSTAASSSSTSLSKHQTTKSATSSSSASSSSSKPSSSVKSSKSPKKFAMNPLNDDIDMMKPTTSTMAATAAATKASVVNNSNHNINNNNNVNAEMQTDCWRMSDEGRYGTPGAAGLNYQEYQEQQQQQQQQQQQPIIGNKNNNDNNDQSMEPSLMDNDNNKSMDKSMEDELMALTTDELYTLIKEYNVLEDKYHTILLLPKESRREVTAGGRDGSAYVLRCLKVWYELPTDVLFSAMSLVDRFLDRMAVKPKHMACMSVASFHLAVKQLGLKPIPPEDLVTISQCGCTPGDLERMTGVIANKLGVQMGVTPITSVSYLRVFYALFYNMAKDIGGEFYEFFKQLIKLEELINRLEILLCDVKTTVIAPSTLSLVLICLHLDFHIKESYTRGSPELKIVFEYILFVQKFMRIPDRVFTCGFSIVADILIHYNGQNKQPYKQRLVWKLSSRTLRVLRPTNRFSSDLPTIEEGIPNAMDDGLRSRTESISSEEEEDWPTSPIIPIFEEC